jgi:hypothetical protein
MRHWVVLILFLLALGALRMVGCGDESPCGNCDDGNPCTMDNCVSDELVLCEVAHRCEHPPVTNGTPCGPDTVCVSGVCGENLCEGVVCDDGLECTKDRCNYGDGTCHFQSLCGDDNECTDDACDAADGKCSHTPVEDGAQCRADSPEPVHWMCEAGTCAAPCDPASEEILQCPIKHHEDEFCCPGIEECTIEC